jgi:hypothetical protein|tara:strand:+ start:515 stop:724 length:210 start_codon:yes stop_codon:yes gene_type:complete
MEIIIKPMRLIFSRTETTWKKVVEDLNGLLIYEEINPIIEEPTEEEFDAWETQTCSLPQWNIVEVIRFI